VYSKYIYYIHIASMYIYSQYIFTHIIVSTHVPHCGHRKRLSVRTPLHDPPPRLPLPAPTWPALSNNGIDKHTGVTPAGRINMIRKQQYVSCESCLAKHCVSNKKGFYIITHRVG